MSEKSDIEAMREKVLADLFDDPDATEEEIRKRYEPGSYGCHEALHMAAAVSSMIDRELLEHPAIAMNADWFHKVHAASRAVADLYQAIGVVHVEAK